MGREGGRRVGRVGGEGGEWVGREERGGWKVEGGKGIVCSRKVNMRLPLPGYGVRGRENP